MTLSDRIAVMDRGEVKQVGAPTEIYEYPISRFVAGFIGSITTFAAEVVSVSGEAALVAVPDLGGSFATRAVPGLAAGQKVTLALRPEKIAISRDAPRAGAGAGNVVRGVVKDLAYFGKDSLYRVTLPSGALVAVHAVNARRSGAADRVADRVADWEDVVWLSFDPAAAILLVE